MLLRIFGISRGQTAAGCRRPFAPLCAQTWTTTAVAYLTEADLLTSKKSEVLSGGKGATSSDSPAQNQTQSESRGEERETLRSSLA